jgi:hypothetical protein
MLSSNATVSVTTLSIMVVITAQLSHLGVSLWHSDIKIAFQGTPAEAMEDRHVWIRLFPEFMEWYKMRKPKEYEANKTPEWYTMRTPKEYEANKTLYKNTKASDLACAMFTHVQGRVNTSQVFGRRATEMLGGNLLSLNPCLYSGSPKDKGPMIVGRATDDMLVMATQDSYNLLCDSLARHYPIRRKGATQFLFGLRVIVTEDAITVDQKHLPEFIVAQVFGEAWNKIPPGERDRIPMDKQVLESFENCERLIDADLKEIEPKFGFKLRSVLCGIMYLSLWNMLALYQASCRPHFVAKSLRTHINMRRSKPLTVPRSHGLNDMTIPSVAAVFLYSMDECNSVTLLFHLVPLVPLTVCLSPLSRHALWILVMALTFLTRRTLLVVLCSWMEQWYTSSAVVKPPWQRTPRLLRSLQSLNLEQMSSGYDSSCLTWGFPTLVPSASVLIHSATRTIALGGKMSRNVRHVAVQTLIFSALSTLVRLPFAKSTLRTIRLIICSELMDLRFLTALHLQAVLRRNQATWFLLQGTL